VAGRLATDGRPPRRAGFVRGARRSLALPLRWWEQQSLRARLTLITTALFALAVVIGIVLTLVVQRYALLRTLDQSAQRTARDIARQVHRGPLPNTVAPTSGGVTAVQVVDGNNAVVAATQGLYAHASSFVTRAQLREARGGSPIQIRSPVSNAKWRVLAKPAGRDTVLVFTDVTRVDDSVTLLEKAALIGGPLAVLLMGAATYLVAAFTLRPVAALRHGAADITAAGLAEQRLPVPGANDEIHRLALTLNAMLDRIDSATSRQRTFVGDAAHELRSPLASLRVQLEVGQRLGPEADWQGLIDDALVDVDRLERLVGDLLALARLDESAATGAVTRVPVAFDDLVERVVAGYVHARVPVTARCEPVTVAGDPDALQRVVINLVDNAVRHAEHQVLVNVDAAPRRGGNMAVLSVVDDGPGIPEAERSKVFDRFYRLHESRSRETGGTGLGLPIVRDIVRNHGGRIRLTDRLDNRPGLRAVVVLPVAESAATDSASSDGAGGPRPARRDAAAGVDTGGVRPR
jgi:signal transduction histidine kinase